MKSQINIESFSQKKFFGGKFWKCLWLLSSSRLFSYLVYSNYFSIKMSDLNGENVSLKLEIGSS